MLCVVHQTNRRRKVLGAIRTADYYIRTIAPGSDLSSNQLTQIVSQLVS